MKDIVEEIVEVTEITEVETINDTVVVDTDKGGDEPTSKEKPIRKRKRDKFEALVDEYGALYPKEKRFCVTSDGQVFFDRDKNMAQYHQSSLSEGELRTIDVER